jgi:hypothetical protein
MRSLMPMIAMTGRSRFVGFSAAIVASDSSRDRRDGPPRQCRQQRDQPSRVGSEADHNGAAGAPQQHSPAHVSIYSHFGASWIAIRDPHTQPPGCSQCLSAADDAPCAGRSYNAT